MDETRLKRIRFRAWRRGFREADLIMGPFADSHAQNLDAAGLDALEILLDQQDQDVYDWITGRTPTPAEFETPVLEQLRDFQRSLPIASGDLSGS